ncbi:MAG: TIGR03960 family B12-binding radical SAM protein [Actinomycetia bacterium]|nr:TIGR03960 family B12-binding radical SAM protein [Actinomycetes bacterium]
MSDTLRARVERLLAGVEQPSRYIDCEWGARERPAATYRAVLAYPDVYDVGMSNQAIQILYDALNAMDGVGCERTFVPWKDMADAMRGADMPLYALESCDPVRDFDLIGITLPYELTYANIVELLDLAHVPVRAASRGEADPLVIAGGPCAYNPEPVAPFFDAILIGDGEEAVAEIVSAHQEARAKGLGRAGVLESLSAIRGMYVPSIHGPEMRPITKRVARNLDAHRSPECPVVPYKDVVHDRVAIEVLRGCARGCRFCQAGMVYRPVRERTPDSVVRDAAAALACTGYEEVSLTSLSTADHSMLADILRRLTRRLEGTGVAISVPSLRVDAFSVEIARLLGGGKKTGLTFAPEAGTQRLRDVINKNVTEPDLLETVAKAFSSGWRRVKLYFMLGLPTEADEDLVGIGDLVTKVLETARDVTPPSERGAIRVAVSVSTFVPKAHTPFQWEAQIPLEEVRRRQAVLRAHMPRKGVELSYHDAEVSFLEAVLARGGREIAEVIETAWRNGARFDAWTEEYSLRRWLEAFDECGVDPRSIANRERPVDEELPWDHISAGVSKAFLRIERGRALEGATTQDCTVAGCLGCGVCGTVGAENVLAAGHRG